MNILILVKNDERDRFLLDYAEKLFGQVDSRIDLLNVTTVSGDIPLQVNGQVLEFCTEFDLSGYEKTAKGHQEYLDSINDPNLDQRKALIGEPFRIIKNYVADRNIDVVISGAHVNQGLAKAAKVSFASRLMKELSIPYISLKCDRSHESVEVIGLLSDFDKPAKVDLSCIKRIQAIHGSQIDLIKVKTPEERISKEQVEANMKQFASLNEINANYIVVEAKTIELGVNEMVDKEHINLLSIGQMHAHTALPWVKDHAKTDVVNHLRLPILIY